MKTWIRPMVVEENLVANARVAESVCYKLSCLVGDGKRPPYGNLWTSTQTPGATHSSSGTPNTCADPNANRIITGDGGLFEGSDVAEHNGQQGWISGYIDKHIDSNNNGKVDDGEVIYWHTTNKAGTTWNHWGTVKLADASHPNHS